MYSSFSHVVNSSPILPVRIEIITVREFAVCLSKSPVGDFGPGVLVVDAGPASDATSYAGWDLPPQVSRTLRLSNVSMLLYFYPSAGRPGYCDAFVGAKLGASIPQWLVPSSLLKRFLVSHYLTSFKAIKTNIVDGWDKLGYAQRIEACPAFYSTTSSIAARL